MELQRYDGNPVLAPTGNWWESKAVFNTAAVKHDGRVHLLYRALGEDNISRLGYASSEDGFHFDVRHDIAVFEPDDEWHFERLGCEDPQDHGYRRLVLHRLYGGFGLPVQSSQACFQHRDPLEMQSLPCQDQRLHHF